MKYCPKCGQPVQENANVCSKCGNRLKASGTPPKKIPPKDGRKKSKTSPMVILCGLLIAALLVAAAGLVYFLLGNMGGSSETSERETETETVQETVTPETSSVGTAQQTVEETGDQQTTEQPTEDANSVLSQVPYYVTGVANTIKVRESAAGDGVVLTKLENGDSVLLVDTEDDQYWKVLVADENVTGYIDHHYLTDEANAVTSPEEYYVVDTPAYMSVLDIPAATGYTELGRLNNGDTVTVLSKPTGSFWYIYSKTLGQYGYVLNAYLSTEAPASATPTATTGKVFGVGAAPGTYIGVYYVHVNSGYLALRNAMAYETSNEIGKMYNGEYVYVLEASGTYWYVYSPTLGMYGYTNHDYLTAGGTSYSSAQATTPTSKVVTTYWTVRVNTGYLALRTAKAYDESNEIGCLYTGDQVEVLDSSDATYWYVYAPSLNKYGYVNSDYLY